jgi:hypothetical protein
MYCRALPLSMPPQAGAGGGTPKPRKLSAASARMALPRPSVAMTMIGATTLGRMWRSTTRRCPAPSARAAST